MQVTFSHTFANFQNGHYHSNHESSGVGDSVHPLESPAYADCKKRAHSGLDMIEKGICIAVVDPYCEIREPSKDWDLKDCSLHLNPSSFFG